MDLSFHDPPKEASTVCKGQAGREAKEPFKKHGASEGATTHGGNIFLLQILCMYGWVLRFPFSTTPLNPKSVLLAFPEKLYTRKLISGSGVRRMWPRKTQYSRVS